MRQSPSDDQQNLQSEPYPAPPCTPKPRYFVLHLPSSSSSSLVYLRQQHDPKYQTSSQATGLSTPGSLEMWWCKMAARWEQDKTDQYRNGRNETFILYCDFKNVFMSSVFSFYQQKHHHLIQILYNGPLNRLCKAGPSCLTIHNTLPKNILAFGTSLSWVNREQIIQRMVKAIEIQPG